jgi:molybdopterin converting factor small subunit
MRVTVILHGSLTRHADPGTPGQWAGEVPPSTRIGELVRLLGIPEGTAIMAAVDGSLKKPDTVLAPNARILLFTPMSGG